MRTLDEELEEVKNDNTKIGEPAPKIMTMSDVAKMGNYKYDEFYKQKSVSAPKAKSDINVMLKAGIERGTQDIAELGKELKIFEGQSIMALGGLTGSDENVEIGRTLLQTSYDELEAREREYANRAIPLEEEYNSLTFGLGQGLVNYGAMLATGYLGGELAGIGTMAAMDVSQKATEKAQYHIEKTQDKDFKEYTPKQAEKDVALTSIYAAGSAILEKKLGYGQQRKLFKISTGEKLKTIGKTALSEGGTEFLQNMYGAGIDLAGGYIDTSKLPEQFMQAIKEGVIGGILGGSAGILAAVNHRSQAKAILRDELKNTVPAKDLDNVVDAVYETTHAKLNEVVAQELVQSEELRNKHGAIYNNLKTEIHKQIQDSGAFVGKSEDEVAQYVESLSSQFADNVLAEANKRNQTIDDVMKASNIRYENGELHLKSRVDNLVQKVIEKKQRAKPDETKMNLLAFLRNRGGLKDDSGELKSRDAQKQYVGLINNKSGMGFDDAALLAWEHGYFPTKTERPTINDLLDAIDRSLHGQKIYREGYSPITEKQQTQLNKSLNEDEYDRLLTDFFSEEEIKGLPYSEKQRLYNEIIEQTNAVSEEDYMQIEFENLSEDEQERYSIMTENGATHEEAMEHIKSNRTDFIHDEDIFEFYQVSNENAKLDEMYPKYEGETININGVDKTVYNSNGERIAQSKEALENFYKWFGDSKVVDEQGRPLVVYHGTNAKFDKFKGSKILNSSEGVGFNFTDGKNVAQGFGNIMPVYLKLENPVYAYGDIDLVSETYEEDFETENREAIKQAVYDVKEILQREGYTFNNQVEPDLLDIYAERSQAQEVLDGLLDLGSFIEEDYDADKLYSDIRKAEIEAFGIDGYVTRDYARTGNKTFVAFNPNQIKSVDNRGTYSAESDNIYYQSEIEDRPYSNKQLYALLQNPEENRDAILDVYYNHFDIYGGAMQKALDDQVVFFWHMERNKTMRGTENKVYQGVGEKIKGSFDKLTKSIKITSKADYSTYQHEFAHFWLDNIWEYMHSSFASKEYTKQWNGVMKWLGMTDDDKYPTRTQHEKFARAYEKYLTSGDVPNNMMGEAFNKYENFIRQVYNSMQEVDTKAGKKYEPMSLEMYDFFDSMVTGKLPMPEGLQESITRDEATKEVQKEIEQTKEVITEEKKVVEERKENYSLMPLQTDNQTGYSSVMEKTTGEKVEMGSIDMRDELEKAEKFVSEHTEDAEKVVKGEKAEPKGMSRNAIYIAYQNLMEKLGNADARAESLLNQAMELRRYGQEISLQRLAYENVDKMSTPQYWIDKILSDKAQALAQANNMKVEDLNKKIDSIIKENKGKSPEEILKKAKEELNVFYQKEPEEYGAYKSIKQYVDAGLGITLTREQVKEIMTRADNMKKNLDNSKSTTGNPSIVWFEQLKAMEDYANELQPSNKVKVLTSIIGRGNLLASIKSPLTNVVSNATVGLYRAALRRVLLKTSENKIDSKKIEDLKHYSWNVFVKTGYNVNSMMKDSPLNEFLGEKITHSEGEGKIRALGRLYEEYIYKWSLGAGDVYFKDKAFIDYLALKCSKGRSSAEANKLFDDAILIEPKTQEGLQLRQEAIDEALLATFQNNGRLSQMALGVRKHLDFGVGLSEYLFPFVKTPANVIGMGLETGFGIPKAIASEILRDIRAGKILPPTQENIRSAVANGLGLVLASLLLEAFDDEDYMPSYEMATSKEKELVKQLNIPYNSVRIGSVWFSLDYLGPLATPLIGLLQARRANNIADAVWGYSKSGALQTLSLPALGNIGDIKESFENMLRSDSDKAMSKLSEDAIESLYSRSVPAIINDFAKAIDEYDRRRRGNEILSRIPFARESLEPNVNLTTGRAEIKTSWDPLIDLFAGSRVKIQVRNRVADEFKRLNDAGWGVSLTDVTQRGLLSSVSEPQQKEVRKLFAQEYAKEVNKLITSNKYKSLSDEDKKEAIDKTRRKIVESLKKKYLKKK